MRYMHFVVAFCASCYCIFGSIQNVLAQDVDVQVLEVPLADAPQDGVFIASEVVVAGVEDGQDAVAFTYVPSPDDVPLPGPLAFSLGEGGFIPNDPLQMLQMPQFENEIQLVDDQIQQLRQLRQEVARINRSVMSKYMPKPGERPSAPPDFQAMQAEMQEVQATIRKKTQEGLQQILLPHQLERLEQVQTQLSFRNQGVAALAGDKLAETLSLTDEQRQQLREKQREYQQRLREEIERLKQDLQDEIMSDVLTISQTQKLKEMLGERYQVQQRERRPLIRSTTPESKN